MGITYLMPTVWANVPGSRLVLNQGFYRKAPGFTSETKDALAQKHKIPTESKTRQTRLATKLDIDREKHAMLYS